MCPQVIMCPDVGHGLTSLIQTAGLGGLYPNTVMLGWSSAWRSIPGRDVQMVRLLLTAAAYNQALIVIKGMEHIPDSGGRMTRPMDIWWMVHDGGLQLLLTTILRKGRVWASCELRVFCVLQARDPAPRSRAPISRPDLAPRPDLAVSAPRHPRRSSARTRRSFRRRSSASSTRCASTPRSSASC